MVHDWLWGHERDRLLRECSEHWKPSTVINVDRPDHVTRRETDLQWLSLDEHWIAPKWHTLALGCAEVLGIAIDSPDALTERKIQLARYQPGHEYDWHIDIDPSGANELRRKLSIVALIAGERTLELNPNAGRMPDMEPGDAIAFPAWLSHRVAPTETERFSLTGWVTGPDWR